MIRSAITPYPQNTRNPQKGSFAGFAGFAGKVSRGGERDHPEVELRGGRDRALPGVHCCNGLVYAREHALKFEHRKGSKTTDGQSIPARCGVIDYGNQMLGRSLDVL